MPRYELMHENHYHEYSIFAIKLLLKLMFSTLCFNSYCQGLEQAILEICKIPSVIWMVEKNRESNEGNTFISIAKSIEYILVQNFDLLNLPGWIVRSVCEEAEHLLIEAEIEEMPFACPLCGSTRLPYHFGLRSRTVFDLPIRMKPVQLFVRRRRFRCRDCSGTFLDPLPGIHANHDATERLVRYVEVHALQLKGTFAGLAKTLGIGEKMVRMIFHTEVTRLLLSEVQ